MGHLSSLMVGNTSYQFKHLGSKPENRKKVPQIIKRYFKIISFINFKIINFKIKLFYIL